MRTESRSTKTGRNLALACILTLPVVGCTPTLLMVGAVDNQSGVVESFRAGVGVYKVWACPGDVVTVGWKCADHCDALTIKPQPGNVDPGNSATPYTAATNPGMIDVHIEDNFTDLEYTGTAHTDKKGWHDAGASVTIHRIQDGELFPLSLGLIQPTDQRMPYWTSTIAPISVSPKAQATAAQYYNPVPPSTTNWTMQPPGGGAYYIDGSASPINPPQELPGAWRMNSAGLTSYSGQQQVLSTALTISCAK